MPTAAARNLPTAARNLPTAARKLPTTRNLPAAARSVPAAILLTAVALTALVGRGQPASALDPGVSHVYIADGRSFADALVGSVLAATEGAPILTVQSAGIPDATDAELKRLAPIDNIVVLGGPAAVSSDVFEALGAYTTPPGNVTRLDGPDRFATAAAISEALPQKVHDADTLDGLDSSAFRKVPRWEYVSIPAAAWIPDSESRDYNVSHNNGGLDVVTGVGCFQTPLTLRDGARLDTVTAYLFDNDDADLTVRLHRHAHENITSSSSRTLSTSGASNAMQVIEHDASSVVPYFIDNQANSYYLTTCFGAGALRVYDVVLKLAPAS